jgi:hypothetical protein
MKKIDEILNEREDEYGDAEENFKRIGIIWAGMLGLPNAIPAWEIALMMDALKTVRLISNPTHKDSWIDKMGYTAHGHAIADESSIKRCKCGNWIGFDQPCKPCRTIDEKERLAERRENENLNKAGRTMIVKGNGRIGIR